MMTTGLREHHEMAGEPPPPSLSVRGGGDTSSHPMYADHPIKFHRETAKEKVTPTKNSTKDDQRDPEDVEEVRLLQKNSDHPDDQDNEQDDADGDGPRRHYGKESKGLFQPLEAIRRTMGGTTAAAGAGGGGRSAGEIRSRKRGSHDSGNWSGGGGNRGIGGARGGAGGGAGSGWSPGSASERAGGWWGRKWRSGGTTSLLTSLPTLWSGASAASTAPAAGNAASCSMPAGQDSQEDTLTGGEGSHGNSGSADEGDAVTVTTSNPRHGNDESAGGAGDGEEDYVEDETAASSSNRSRYLFFACQRRRCYDRCCDLGRYTRTAWERTVNVMNILARLLLWSSMLAMVVGVIYYSVELRKHGKEPHFVAWFSAGAFCILGFPISMYGIISHLANYYQPNVQCYVVRILWMVPIYSIESWLCLRFHKYAIYIETLRDCYESYVLYSFLQFLIEVLGGEEELVLLLKDKSPTRGVHFTPLNWCIRPWLMGQPVSRHTSFGVNESATGGSDNTNADMAPLVPFSTTDSGLAASSSNLKPIKRVQWTSPFFVKCKFGVIQYVLLKILTAIAVVILEANSIYKENNFSVRGGYLYICILTNWSQCWALYCLAFFYYATHNELSPIRPVGKFLSVKALVFFTWWQSVCISMLSQWKLIPDYAMGNVTMSPEEVAKAFQDYLICVEMFIASIVHTFVFPHSDYLSPIAVGAHHNHNAYGGRGGKSGVGGGGGGGYHHSKRTLGRKGRWATLHHYHHHGRTGSFTGGDDKSSVCSKNSAITPMDYHDLESTGSGGNRRSHGVLVMDDFVVTGDVPTRALYEKESEMVSLMAGVGGGGHDDDDDEDHEEEDAVKSVVDTSSPLSSSMVVDTPTSIGTGGGGGSRRPRTPTRTKGRLSSSSSSSSKSPRTRQGNPQQQEMAPPQAQQQQQQQRQGFVRALIESTVPLDVMEGTVGIVKGDYNVEKKTLLHHAATSDEYDLFSKRKFRVAAPPVSGGGVRRTVVGTSTTSAASTPPPPPPLAAAAAPSSSSSSSSLGGAASNAATAKVKSAKEQE